jgi:hypothetical protein
MKVKSAQAGGGGGVHANPLSQYKVVVYAAAEREDTLSTIIISPLPLYVLCVVDYGMGGGGYRTFLPPPLDHPTLLQVQIFIDDHCLGFPRGNFSDHDYSCLSLPSSELQYCISPKFLINIMHDELLNCLFHRGII